MKLQSIETATSHKRTCDLQNAEPQQISSQSHRHGSKQYLPTSISIEWDEGREPRQVSITGTVLHKDGTASGVTAVGHYSIKSCPAWAKEAVEELFAHV